MPRPLAREHEINEQRRLLTLGLFFAVPFHLLDGAGIFNCCRLFFYEAGAAMGMEVHAMWWVGVDHVRPGYAVQFYVGWQYYVGAFKALRNGSATWTS